MASIQELQEEIKSIEKRIPAFKDDAAFVFWFINAYLTDNESLAKNSLTGKLGGPHGEKNIDAIYIDDAAKQCNIIQGKFHTGEVSEKLNDVLSFADLATLPRSSESILESFYSKLDNIALDKFKKLTTYVVNKNYKLNLYYVTTGKCTETIIHQAKVKVIDADPNAEIFVITRKQLLSIFRDYINDITPHLPSLKLRIVSEGSIQHEGTIHRFDPKTQIESWVLSASGEDLSKMYETAGRRLFAKNIRGWLEGIDKEGTVNESIASTIRKEPENFWYYNNGVTIVCDGAKRQSEGGEDYVIIDNAQIINGQQTTRTLAAHNPKDTNVLVKIIKIPNEPDNEGNYDTLVNSIVRAANWQNYISPSDLISNDSVQIYLEKEFRKIGYQYIRKRMSKGEARSQYGHGYHQITKFELARASAASMFDQIFVRKGKEHLFEDPLYKSVFCSKQVSFYLPRYWLMRQMQYRSHVSSNRGYANWLVLNFVWKILEKSISHGDGEKRFRYACEHSHSHHYVLKPLQNSIDDVFKAAIKFYHSNNEERDISTFFLNSSNRNAQFEVFWHSTKNLYKKKFNSHIDKFEKALNAVEIEA